MRKIILILVTVLSFTATNAISENPAKKAKKQLHTKIVALLDKVDFSFDQEIVANVRFIVNTNGEIIVLSVNSNNTQVSEYVKRKLNYKKIAGKQGDIKVYDMPLRVVTPE